MLSLDDARRRTRKALEKRLLIITKANSRATVHRSAYLDYIGFKIFDADGDVIGERRFLGPVLARPPTAPACATCRWSSARWPRCWTAPGCQPAQPLRQGPAGRSWRPTRATSCSRSRTDDLYRTVMGVLRLAGRRQLRLFLRRDAYGRFISCLVYLPRDRFTTANRLRMQEILLRELNGIGVDYTTRVTESMLARVHFIVRTDPANPPGDDRRRRARPSGSPTRPGSGTTTSGWCWSASSATSRPSTLLDRGTPARCPDSYKDEHTPYEAVQDLAKLELLDEPGQLVMHLFRRRRAGPTTRRAVQGLPVRRADDALRRAAGAALARRAGHRRAARTRCAAPTAPIYLYDFGLQLPAGRTRARRGARHTWRTRSPPPGAARPRWTGSTSWCCGPG